MHGSEALLSADGALSDALAAIHAATDLRPEIGLILGSGLGPLADEIEVDADLPYGDVPGMATSTAPGHAGRFVVGHLEGRAVIAMRGRLHPYDGVPAAQIAFPVRIMRALGAQALVVSNACGGLAPGWQAGDLMLQTDLINATGSNPLVGPNDDRWGPRFPVMFDCYDPEYAERTREAARGLDLGLREGVYLAISGPSYATRAELRMYRAWGADAIGMSTVHEVIAARHAGLRVLGVSTVTDMALPDRNEHATGEDVLRVAEASGASFRRLVRAVLPRL